MKITVTNTYTLTYQVESFEATEGGMVHEQFGEPVKTIEGAITNLLIAEKSRPGYDWIITVDVQKDVKGKQEYEG